MADIIKVVPATDYSADDFLSTDYQTTAEDQVIITESVNYLKVRQIVKQVSEQIAIQESIGKAQALVRKSDEIIAITEEQPPIAARTLSRIAPTDQIAITETAQPVFAAPPIAKQVTETITISEQVNWLLQEAPPEPVAPPASSAMYLSPAARKRLAKHRAPQLVQEEEEKSEELLALLTKVTSSRKFVYSISDAQIFQDFEQIKSALEQIKLKHPKKDDATAKSDEIEEQLVEPVVAKDHVIGRDDTGTVINAPLESVQSDLKQTVEKSSSVQHKVTVRSALKMQYDILSPDQEAKTKFVSAIRARYDIKDSLLHQKLMRVAKLTSALELFDLLDSINI